MKSRLGVSVGILGAAAYFMGLLSGYVVLALLVGYVLLFEENPWLRRTAVKAIALTLALDVLCALIGLIPDTVDLIDSLLNIFEDDFTLHVVTRITGFLTTAVRYGGKILLLFLGFNALHQGVVRIPVVDKLLDKHM